MTVRAVGRQRTLSLGAALGCCGTLLLLPNGGLAWRASAFLRLSERGFKEAVCRAEPMCPGFWGPQRLRKLARGMLAWRAARCWRQKVQLCRANLSVGCMLWLPGDLGEEGWLGAVQKPAGWAWEEGGQWDPGRWSLRGRPRQPAREGPGQEGNLDVNHSEKRGFKGPSKQSPRVENKPA